MKYNCPIIIDVENLYWIKENTANMQHSFCSDNVLTKSRISVILSYRIKKGEIP